MFNNRFTRGITLISSRKQYRFRSPKTMALFMDMNTKRSKQHDSPIGRDEYTDPAKPLMGQTARSNHFIDYYSSCYTDRVAIYEIRGSKRALSCSTVLGKGYPCICLCCLDNTTQIHSDTSLKNTVLTGLWKKLLRKSSYCLRINTKKRELHSVLAIHML